MFRLKTILTGCLIVSVLTVATVSCKTASRDEKFYEKQEAKMQKMEQKEYDKKLKEIHKMQSPATLKMMRETKKESRKLNKQRKR